MKSDSVAVTLHAQYTAEGLAMACRDFAAHGWPRCPVGFHFKCPLVRLGNGRCGKIEAEDWEAVMMEVAEDDPAGNRA